MEIAQILINTLVRAAELGLLAIGLTISVEALTLVTGASLVFLDLAQGS